MLVVFDDVILALLLCNPLLALVALPLVPFDAVPVAQLEMVDDDDLDGVSADRLNNGKQTTCFCYSVRCILNDALKFAALKTTFNFSLRDQFEQTF